MKIKHYQLESLIMILSELRNKNSLKAKYSRSVLKTLNNLLSYYETEFYPYRSLLFEEFAVRDNKGEIIYTDDNKINFRVDIEKLTPHLEEFMNEYHEIELNSINKNLLLPLSEILLEGDFNVKPNMAEIYDEICMECERVIEYYESLERG